ncbi:beta-galactoside-binding lectin-like [Parambassis ranga]|uniref:Galectin n=1 Tax=Parambassis ranga TaxID=210632 RepID=A0A6P7IFY6_9TELE|nr:beta-galactoside-binding lectin-like [Parambassis ranga]
MTGMIINNWSFKEGQTLTITGFIKSNATSFAVNINNSNNNDIALRISPRFSVSSDDEMVVFNSRKGGVWGSEIRQPGNPFTQGKDFTIVINFTRAGFQGNLQDKSFTFPNRLEEDKYTGLSFEGGARIQSTEIK